MHSYLYLYICVCFIDYFFFLPFFLNSETINYSDEIINRNDVTLPWRPFYDLYYEATYKKNIKNLDRSLLRSTALAVKELFPLSATAEILDEVSFN